MQTHQPVNTSGLQRQSLRLFWLFLIILLYGTTVAQDNNETAQAESSIPSPAMLTEEETAVLDSFYSLKQIDYRNSPNTQLYHEIFKWYKTCYRYGGNSSKGIDCSHFVNMLYEKIYGKVLAGSSAAMFQQCTPLKNGISHAEEGDLLFFKIRKKRISHVGLYLGNGKFAHASTHSGVIISDLSEPYYQRHFYKAGRMEPISRAD